MADIKLKAEVRNELGRKVKALRRKGVLPANLYGKGIKSVSLSVDLKEFNKVYAEAGETGIVELTVGGKTHPTLIHNISIDPIEGKPLHAEFLQVDLKQKVTTQVPLELVGESPAEKQGLGTIVKYADEIEVESLPGDIPDHLEIDLSSLDEVDKFIKVADLSYDKKKVEVKEDPEKMLVKVEPLTKEEEVVPPPTEAEETPAEGASEEKPEGEGEAGQAETP